MLLGQPPVLDADHFPAAPIGKAGDISGGVKAVGDPQIFIHRDAAVGMAGHALKEFGGRLHPEARYHQIGRKFLAGVQDHGPNLPVTLQPGDPGPQAEGHALLLEDLLDDPADLRAQLALERNGARSDHGNLQAPLGEAVSRLHADEAGPHHHGLGAPAWPPR